MISIILPTVGNREKEICRLFESLLNQNYKNFEVVLVVQDNFSEMKKIYGRYEEKLKIKFIESKIKGLSIARNIGMKYVEGNIVIFSDDDAWYFNESLEIVREEIIDKDIICMEIEDPIKKIKYKNYDRHKKKVGKLQILKKSSIEICVNLENVNKDDVRFNEEFGLGGKYKSGEENIFLNKMLKNKKKIEYISKSYIYHEKKENQRINIKDKMNLFKEIYGDILGRILAYGLFLKNISRLNW